jgi:hypothetical protein
LLRGQNNQNGQIFIIDKGGYPSENAGVEKSAMRQEIAGVEWME